MLSACMAGCSYTKPQRPTQHSGKGEMPVDSSMLQLMELNRQMAEAADSELARRVDTLEGYNLLPCGAWVRYSRNADDNDTITPQPDERWTIAMQVRELSGDLLVDEHKQITIHRSELPTAAQEAIETMHHGETAHLYAPWYVAYGMSGTQQIAPYTNVQIDIQLLR